MFKLKITRVQKFVAPGLDIGKATSAGGMVKRRIARAALASIMDNVKKQQQADGSLIKENTPGTRRSKAARGTLWHGVAMSLVDEEHRFVKPANWRSVWQGKVLTIEPLEAGGDPGLKTLVEEVQERGYTGWFAVQAADLEALGQILLDWVHKKLQAAQDHGADADVDGGEDVPVKDPDEDT